MSNEMPIAYDKKSKHIILFGELKEKQQIDSDSLMPLFLNDFVIMLGARRGAGKSYLCAEIIKNWSKIYKERKIFYISKIKKGVETDDMKLPKRALRLDVINDFMSLRDDLSMFKNSLMCFDDIYDSRLNDKEQKALMDSIKDLMENSRHDNISLVLTAHMFMNGKNCTLLNELSHIVVYPKFSNLYQIKNVLKEYIGLSKQEIDRICKTESRWVIIHTIGEKYILTQSELYLYN